MPKGVASGTNTIGGNEDKMAKKSIAVIGESSKKSPMSLIGAKDGDFLKAETSESYVVKAPMMS